MKHHVGCRSQNIKSELTIAFLALQGYFVSIVFSFTIWEIGLVGFLHAALYFGAWVIALTGMLVVFLRFVNSEIRPRRAMLVAVALSVPMFGIWLQVFNLTPRWIEYVAIAIFPVFCYSYYRVSVLHIRKMSALVCCLFIVSIFSHSNPSFFDNSEEFKPYSQLKMERRPNIHVIMFDSLTTSAYTREFLEIENPASQFLATLDNTIFAGNRGFVEAVTTRKSWSTLFHLGTSSAQSVGVFSGAIASPLTTLLNSNDYMIQTGFSTKYLGYAKGEHVDEYYYDNRDWRSFKTAACEQKLLGYCSKFSGMLFQFINSLFPPAKELLDDSITWEDFVLKKIKESEQRINSPVFSAFHIYAPGHWFAGTSMNEKNFEKFREFYLSGSMRVFETLQKIEDIRKDYPRSIFIISGDHGPFISSGYDKVENKRFLTLDSRHVSLALINEDNLCTYERNWLQNNDVFTPTLMLIASLSCDGEESDLLFRHKSHDSNWKEWKMYGSTLTASVN